MTTSYRLQAIKDLRAQKKIDREAEAGALADARAEAEKAHQANMARIAEKEARIASGQPAPAAKPEPKPEPEPEVEAEVAEEPKSKPAAKKKTAKAKKSK